VLHCLLDNEKPAFLNDFLLFISVLFRYFCCAFRSFSPLQFQSFRCLLKDTGASCFPSVAEKTFMPRTKLHTARFTSAYLSGRRRRLVLRLSSRLFKSLDCLPSKTKKMGCTRRYACCLHGSLGPFEYIRANSVRTQTFARGQHLPTMCQRRSCVAELPRFHTFCGESTSQRRTCASNDSSVIHLASYTSTQ